MSNIHQVRAAAYLNNTGISLLKRGCFPAAIETFRDGIYIIQNSSTHPCEAPGDSLEDMPACLDRSFHPDSTAVLQKAAQRLSRSNTDKCAAKAKMAFEPLSDYESLTVLCNLLFFDGAPHYPLPAFYPIVLDLIDSEDVCNSEEITLTASVVFYNCAIAFRCLSATSKLRRHTDKSLSIAKELFDKAHKGHSEICRSYDQISRGILLESLALYNLINLSPYPSRERMEYISLLAIERFKTFKLIAIESTLCGQTASAA